MQPHNKIVKLFLANGVLAVLVKPVVELVERGMLVLHPLLHHVVEQPIHHFSDSSSARSALLLRRCRLALLSLGALGALRFIAPGVALLLGHGAGPALLTKRTCGSSLVLTAQLHLAALDG